jgi:hypothetical protein
MRFLRTSWLLLVLPTAVKGSNSSADQHDEEDPKIPSFMDDRKASLRGTDLDNYGTELQTDATVPIANLGKPIGELSMEERTTLLSTLYKTFEEALAILPDLDVSEMPGFERLIGSGLEHANAAKKPASDVIQFIRDNIPSNHEKEREEEEDEELRDETVALEARVQQQRRAKEKRSRNESRKAQEEQEERVYSQRQRRTSFSAHQGSSSGFTQQSHFHSKVHSFKDAVLDGDHHSVRQTLRGFQQTHNARMQFNKSSNNGESGRRLTKDQQCKLLAVCASGMSMYDLFVYIMSDDIDPASGSVDDNIVKFDEANMKQKYDNIQVLATAIKGPDGTLPTTCDNLLEQFHRTKEYGDVPQWEGATVSQVCLSQGTMTYVKLGDAAASSFSMPNLDSAISTLEFAYANGDSLYYVLPGALKQISVAEDGTVWGVNSNDNIFRGTAVGDSWNWVQVEGGLSKVSVQNVDSVWGVNSADDIYHWTSSTSWVKISGKLNQISVASDGTVWGVNAAGNIFRRTAESWELMDGGLKHVSVQNADSVWGVNSGDSIFHWTAATNWVLFTGKLKQIDVATDGTVWGVNSADDIWRRTVDNKEWELMTGKLKHVSVGANSNIYGVNSNENIFHYSAGLESFFDSVSSSFLELIQTFAEEAINCAEEMFYSNDRTGNSDFDSEQFVFGQNGDRPNGDATKFRFPIALDVSTTETRTQHGQLKGNSRSAFLFQDYALLLEEYKACDAEHNGIAKQALTSAIAASTIEAATEIFTSGIDQYIGNLTEECIADVFEVVGTGLEFVFGDHPSPGFICGIKDAIVTEGLTIPGSCCLDAPFQLDGDDWGRQVSKLCSIVDFKKDLLSDTAVLIDS